MSEETEKKSSLYSEMCFIAGPENVTKEEAARRSYTRGPFMGIGGGGRGKTPGIVVRPGSTEEISEIVKLANRTKTPIVPKGGSGAVATFPPVYVGTDENILIDTTRMNRILEINEEYMTVKAECGVILSNLQAEVKERGFHLYTVDTPVHMDTIGGVLSGFLGGGEPSDLATSGTMNNYLLGLKVVLPTGDIIETGGGPGTNIHQKRILHREAGSPDTTGLFVADGGAFGIKTEATFSIHPYPSKYVPGIYNMGSDESMWKAFNELARTDPYAYTRLLAFREQGDDWFFIYVIRGYSDEETASKKRVLDKICQSHGGKPAGSGHDGFKIANMFSTHRLGQQVLPTSSAMTFFGEAVVPRPVSLEYVRDLNALIDEKLGDLNFYKRVDFTLPYLRATTISGVLLYFGKEHSREEVSKRVYKDTYEQQHRLMSEKYGGWVETAQGESAALSASAWSPAYKAFMQTLKKTLDPNNILMPGLWRI